MNDEKRQQWIDNDEHLYDAQQRSGMSMRNYIRANRKMIDAYIAPILSNERRQHYGKYG